jgi:hypothetical protein
MPSPRKHSESKATEKRRENVERDNSNNNEELLKKIFERLDADRVKAR